MTAIDILIAEHQLIKQFLSVLGSMIDKLDRGEKPKVDDLRTAVQFIKDLADGMHHAKEEKILFREIEALGIEDEFDQIGNLQTEHFLGRTFCESMEESLEQIRDDDSEGVSAFVDNGRAYIALLIQHICKEDKQFFPWCEERINAALADKLLSQFHEVMKTEPDNQIKQKWADQLSRLRDVYGESAEVIKACH